MCLSQHKKMAPIEQREMTQSKSPLLEQSKVFGAKTKTDVGWAITVSVSRVLYLIKIVL